MGGCPLHQTDRHNITEILLKMALKLNTITPLPLHKCTVSDIPTLKRRSPLLNTPLPLHKCTVSDIPTLKRCSPLLNTPLPLHKCTVSDIPTLKRRSPLLTIEISKKC